MKKLILLATTLLLAVTASAADEMRKLDFMLGDWKGVASVQMGPGKPQLTLMDEHVQSKLGGKALLINGLGNRKMEDGSAGDVVHEALAVISWDDAAKKYRFDAWTARDGYVAAWIEPGDRKATWGFDTAQGSRIRYTITIDEKGQWHEVGEFSRDGKQWMGFFDMTLHK